MPAYEVSFVESSYLFIEDLLANTQVPENGILSKTLQNDERTKIILFCFAPGQELSAHSAPFPATLYFVSGEASVKLGADEGEGWVMLLTMAKGSQGLVQSAVSIPPPLGGQLQAAPAPGNHCRASGAPAGPEA